MKVIKPSLIADASLISSTVPETEHSAYGAGTSYTLGARVIYQHVIYECIQTPNTGNTPLSRRVGRRCVVRSPTIAKTAVTVTIRER